MKHVPTPAPSKSNGGAIGRAKILLASSVMIYPSALPLAASVNDTESGSGLPSIQIEVLIPPSAKVIVPPFTAQTPESISPVSSPGHIVLSPTEKASTPVNETSLLSD